MPTEYILFVLLSASVVAILALLKKQRDAQGRIQKLRTEKNGMRQLLDAYPDLLWLKNAQGVYISCNQTFASRFNKNIDEIVGKTDADLGQNELLALCSKGDAESLENKRMLFSNQEIAGDRGTVFDLMKTRVLDAEGNPVAVLGVLRDVRARKLAEDKLHENQMLMQLVMDNIPQFIFWKDVDSVYLGCNKNFADASGQRHHSEIVGKTDYDLPWKKEEADFFRDCDKRVMNSREAEYHIIEPQLQADGKEAWLDTNKVPLIDDQGTVIGMLGTFEDITARKKMQDDLLRSEENMSITLNSLGDAVISTDINGIVLRMNPVAQRLTGWTEAAGIGTGFDEIFSLVQEDDDGLLESPLVSILEKGEQINNSFDVRLVSREGIEHEIALSGAPIRTEENVILGAVVVFRDVSTERKLQDQLHHSQKLDAIGQLAGGIAHDFNNVLTGIMGASEIIKCELDECTSGTAFSVSKITGLNKMVMDSSLRAAELTEKLLFFARRQPTLRKVVNVHDIIKDVVIVLENTIDRRITITFESTTDQASVYGDVSQLQSAILNMGINASHAMPQGGTFTIHSELMELDSAACDKHAFDLNPGKYLQVTLSDTGLGMPPDIMSKIFDPFFTTKGQGKGTGLGLSAVYGTIQQHAGTITVSSVEGEGTAFVVLLPLTDDAEKKAPVRQHVMYGTESILVVDDERIIRKTVQTILTELGYKVTVAENGLDAMNIFEKNPNAFDVVLLDMIMPVMNGRDCFVEMRKIKPDIKVILSSGYSEEGDFQDMQDGGLSGFVRKPYTRMSLSTAVRHAIQGVE